MAKSARLVLQSGAIFRGELLASQKAISGEVVFTTGMTGYVESLTDPSYTGQIVVFTFPLIGNYGIPKDGWESEKVRPNAVVVSETTEQFSHADATQSLSSWLKKAGVPLLTGVDTRALTQQLRDGGATLGAITIGEAKPVFVDPNVENIVASVSPVKPQTYQGNVRQRRIDTANENSKRIFRPVSKKIIVVDCGMKENILRSLKTFPLTIKRVPFDYDYTKEQFDGVFISNGPGDPARCVETIAILKKALEFKKPIFGICLGSQLLALAAGAKTYKLPFGHRGHNQPCQETTSERAYITSQNHGYAVDEKTIPDGWYVNFRNLNDDSVEGIAHQTLPFFSVQFHPEAAPGPTDTAWLFEKFYSMLK